MRILLYNFVQPEEPGAGGVGIYITNLARFLARDHEVILLSSGDRYSPRHRDPRLEHHEDAFRRSVIVNSPVVAPAGYSFAEPDTYVESRGLDFAPRELLEKYGSIDVFHFQNIEGLTASFFRKLRKVFPEARIIYSAHNYHPLCSRFTLWYQDRMVCEDYRDGVACTMCRVPTFDLKSVRNRRRLNWMAKAHPRFLAPLAPALRIAKVARRALTRLRSPSTLAQGAATGDDPLPPMPVPPAPAMAYRAFREANIALVREVFDRVLAVSERTRKVIVDRGIPADKVAVSYIGTAHQTTYLASVRIRDIGEGLHLGYIGYMQRDKGFTFLLDCLEQMPDELAARISVTVAAKNIYPERHARLLALEGKFRLLRYFDGYTHADLDDVLTAVNLGLIPVQWEDNLPQTAIELVSRGIPILTSDRGGAQEIAKNDAFIFQAGDHEAFNRRLALIAAGTLPLAAFWNGPMRIFSMNDHVADLLRYYAPQAMTKVIQGGRSLNPSGSAD